MKDPLSVVAICPRGLEVIVSNELTYLLSHIKPKIKKGGVFFIATAEEVCMLNLWARTPTRLLIVLARTQAKSARELYNCSFKIQWKNWFLPGRTIKVDVNGRGFPKDVSLRYASLIVKDAICDFFRNEYGVRPNIDTKNPDIRIWINFDNSLVTISIDSTGQPLYKRGWRKEGFIAPLKENLAASLIKLTEWDKKTAIIDPMCGSGTFIIEAAGIAAKLPANFILSKKRVFSYQLFADSSPFGNINTKKIYLNAERVWRSGIETSQTYPSLFGFDISQDIIDQAKKNAFMALPKPLAEKISWGVKSLHALTRPNFDKGMILTNPPYGKRMGKISSMDEFITIFSSILKKQFTGWSIWLLTNEKEIVSKIKLRASKKIALRNGDIECFWCKFDIFKGSKFRKESADDNTE
ncbi:MAG: class I SAM-dependent RNA methyltransferase [Burkholderiaceae bacterium]|nr:MAG: class I SAM-dependent RNA methyltransferase [Burkholderiaceae bacterium]